jgi:integrase
MPKRAHELSALAVSKIRTDGRHSVGGAAGLYLRVEGGSRAWVLRIKVAGRRREMGLGAATDLTLADARIKALKIRRAVSDGEDPLEERRRRQAQEVANALRLKTFTECTVSYIEAHRPGWKSEKHAAQWLASLKTYAYPFIGNLPVSAIDTELVLKVLNPIWTTKTETATRVRSRIECILDWAKVRGHRDGDNPARWKGNLRYQLPARNKVQKVWHHPALPYVRVGLFMEELRKHEGVSVRALEFAILTVARSGEVRGATWEEIDLQALRWTIPAARMKREREHVVPLSSAAAALLKSMPRLQSCNLVFPSPTGKVLCDASLGAVIDDMHAASIRRGGIGYLDPWQDRIVTQHGFRSSFRDWAAEIAYFPSEVRACPCTQAEGQGGSRLSARDAAHQTHETDGGVVDVLWDGERRVEQDHSVRSEPTSRVSNARALRCSRRHAIAVDGNAHRRQTPSPAMLL